MGLVELANNVLIDVKTQMGLKVTFDKWDPTNLDEIPENEFYVCRNCKQRTIH